LKKYIKIGFRFLILVGIGLLWIGRSMDENTKIIVDRIGIALIVIYVLQIIFRKRKPDLNKGKSS